MPIKIVPYLCRSTGTKAHSPRMCRQSYVLDAQGKLRLFARYDRIAHDLAGDLRTLMRGSA